MPGLLLGSRISQRKAFRNGRVRSHGKKQSTIGGGTGNVPGVTPNLTGIVEGVDHQED